MAGVTYSDYYSNKGKAKAQATRAQYAGVKARRATVMDSSTPYKPTSCAGVTRKGTACRARPVKNHELCVGHMRQAEAAFEEDELNE